MTPTPEEIEQLRISGETLSAIAAKAARTDELEGNYRELLARAKIAEAELAKQCQLVKNQANRANYAEEQLTHLAKFIGLHGMTWAHVVSEAVSLIERQKRENDGLRSDKTALLSDNQVLGDLAKQRTAERDALIHSPKTAKEIPGFYGKLAEGLLATIATLRTLVESLESELAEARAENGAQAALIASMMMPSTIETPHTGRDDKALFRDWMESGDDKKPTTIEDVLRFLRVMMNSPHLKPFASLEEYAAALTPLRLEVGKTYVRRDGGRETIAYEDHQKELDFRFIAESSHAYRKDGRFCAIDDHDHDLVAEDPAEEAPTSKAQQIAEKWNPRTESGANAKAEGAPISVMSMRTAWLQRDEQGLFFIDPFTGKRKPYSLPAMKQSVTFTTIKSVDES